MVFDVAIVLLTVHGFNYFKILTLLQNFPCW